MLGGHSIPNTVVLGEAEGILVCQSTAQSYKLDQSRQVFFLTRFFHNRLKNDAQDLKKWSRKTSRVSVQSVIKISL
jgi:hypothetical protein